MNVSICPICMNEIEAGKLTVYGICQECHTEAKSHSFSEQEIVELVKSVTCLTGNCGE